MFEGNNFLWKGFTLIVQYEEMGEDEGKGCWKEENHLPKGAGSNEVMHRRQSLCHTHSSRGDSGWRLELCQLNCQAWVHNVTVSSFAT